MDASPERSGRVARVPLRRIAREWTWIGCVGFGGPAAHIALLRQLCVERERWIDPRDFQDAVAATQLLPGPGSTQLAILLAHRLGGGPAAALVGGFGFIVPGLIVILALAALFVGSPPDWIRGAGGGGGAAVAAVALQQGVGLARDSARTAPRVAGLRVRLVVYAVAGAAAAALVGAWVVLVLIACGAIEVVWRGLAPRAAAALLPLPLLAVAGTGGLGALVWVAMKVGALSYGSGFVIIPLMQHDAVDVHGWMTGGEFLNAVALGQVTPGPVVHTVAVVGYAAAGVGGGLLAAAVAFSPSFAFVLLGAGRFDQLLANARVRAFIDGAGPAAIGAIAGSSVPLALALETGWQWVLLVLAIGALLLARRGVVEVLLAAGVAGTAIVLLGGAVPA